MTIEPRYPEINLGATICEKLKVIYFSETPWPQCYKDVAKKFTELKIIMRKFYADRSELYMLKELAQYSSQDLEECFCSP